MTLLFRWPNLKFEPGTNPEAVATFIQSRLAPSDPQVRGLRVVREAVDARRGKPLKLVWTVEFELDRAPAQPLPKGLERIDQSRLDIPRPRALPLTHSSSTSAKPRTLVIGAGPAGLFAALALGEAGVPTILIERGKPVETRMRDIGQLRSKGELDPESNVCFGEGGAGTYTDGKLYTRVKHPYVRWIMQRLVDFGAPSDILIQAHPHLGTDKLVKLVRTMRGHLQDIGVEIRFQSRMDQLLIEDGQVKGVVLNDQSVVACDRVVLAIGHSARDTLASLLRSGVTIEAKPFAVGVRAEHPQGLINRAQFGHRNGHELMGAAAYQLTYQHPDPLLGKRGVYSFCMCPGGFIVPSPTEPDHMAINGMSNANRSAPFANSGIVVQVTPEDLVSRGYEDTPLVGIAFQRDLELKAFDMVEEPYRAPAMRIDDFLKKRPRARLAETHFRPGVVARDLWSLLPDWIAEPLAAGLANFDRKISGYAGSEGNLLAVESRTSSPVRVVRDPSLQAVGVRGLFPVGEGAGYAGGIVSAAVDGLRAAEAIIGVEP